MANTVTNPGSRLAGLLSDLGHKLKVGRLTEDELALFLKRQNPFPSVAAKHSKKIMKQSHLNTFIEVDRFVRPTYPDWVAAVMNPELQTVGPTKYDLAKVEQFLHDDQKGAPFMSGNALYDHLKQSDSLKNCLGVHDAIAIQALGIKVFLKLFQGKTVFCWKSVVRDDYGGGLFVPVVCRFRGRLVVDWYCILGVVDGGSPALRFAGISK